MFLIRAPDQTTHKQRSLLDQNQPFEMKSLNTKPIFPRDPNGEKYKYERLISESFEENKKFDRMVGDLSEDRIEFNSKTLLPYIWRHASRHCSLLYWGGYEIYEVQAELEHVLGWIWGAEKNPNGRRGFFRKAIENAINPSDPANDDLAFVGLCCLTLPSTETLSKVFRSVSHSDSYILFDLIFEKFGAQKPQQLGSLAPKSWEYVSAAPAWSHPLFFYMLDEDLTKSERSAAASEYLRNWGRLNRGHGWDPISFSNARCDPEDPGWPFVQFAIEAALVVCGSDLDDSDFKEHPYYPRDLVENYRTNLRNQRDFWRTGEHRSAIKFLRPTPKTKPDLSQSPLTGASRWVELATDRDADSITELAALQNTQTDASFPKFLNQAKKIHENFIHSYDFLQSVLDRITVIRGWDIFPQNQIKIENIMNRPLEQYILINAFGEWVKKLGYVQYFILSDPEYWYIAIIQREFQEEFVKLSDALGVRTKKFGRCAGELFFDDSQDSVI